MAESDGIYLMFSYNCGVQIVILQKNVEMKTNIQIITTPKKIRF